MTPCIAILDANTLSTLALQDILWDLFPEVDVVSFSRIEDFIADCDHYFIYYFVSERLMLGHTPDFDMLQKETIVTTEGDGRLFREAGFQVLDISLPEQELAGAILHLHEHSLSGTHTYKQPDRTALSARERDVLALMVRGYLNKEIADRLCISLSTVIFHRNNICSKLGTRSLGKLTIFAVLSGIVELNDI